MSRSGVIGALFVAAASLAGCGDTFNAGIFLTIEPLDARAAQGFLIEVRRPDGRPFDGVGSTFQPSGSGEQSINLLFASDALFEGDDARKVRVYVEARETEAGQPFALGSQVVTARRGETVPAAVTLTGPPDALSGAAAVWRSLSTEVGTPSTGIEVDLRGQPLPEGHLLIAWQADDLGTTEERLTPLGAILESPTTFALTDASAAHGIALSLEPADSIARPVRSSGWLTHRAAWGVDLVAPYDDLLSGTLAEVVRAATVARDHAGFAADANGSARLGHLEHTCRALVGAAAPECDHNLDGQPQFAIAALSTHPGLGASPQLGGRVQQALVGIFENFGSAHLDPATDTERAAAKLRLDACGLIDGVDAAEAAIATAAGDDTDDAAAAAAKTATQAVLDAVECITADLPTWLLLPLPATR